MIDHVIRTKTLEPLNPLFVSAYGLQAHLHGLIDSETNDNKDHKKSDDYLKPLESRYC